MSPLAKRLRMCRVLLLALWLRSFATAAGPNFAGEATSLGAEAVEAASRSLRTPINEVEALGNEYGDAGLHHPVNVEEYSLRPSISLVHLTREESSAAIAERIQLVLKPEEVDLSLTQWQAEENFYHSPSTDPDTLQQLQRDITTAYARRVIGTQQGNIGKMASRSPLYFVAKQDIESIRLRLGDNRAASLPPPQLGTLGSSFESQVRAARKVIREAGARIATLIDARDSGLDGFDDIINHRRIDMETVRRMYNEVIAECRRFFPEFRESEMQRDANLLDDP